MTSLNTFRNFSFCYGVMHCKSCYHVSLLIQRTRDALNWYLHGIRPFVFCPPPHSKINWAWLHNNKTPDAANGVLVSKDWWDADAPVQTHIPSSHTLLTTATPILPLSNPHSVFRYTVNHRNTDFAPVQTRIPSSHTLLTTATPILPLFKPTFRLHTHC